jgi:hypothetical protein
MATGTVLTRKPQTQFSQRSIGNLPREFERTIEKMAGSTFAEALRSEKDHNEAAMSREYHAIREFLTRVVDQLPGAGTRAL